MAPINLLLKIGVGILMVDALIEMAFISSMVRWLNTGASGPYTVNYKGSTFALRSEPLNILTDQGHTSNAAGGSAFVLVGLGGIIALWLHSRTSYHTSTLSKVWYRSWLGLTVPATLLTLAALIYVNVVTEAHDGQTIDIDFASTLDGKYPLQSWTPQNWFGAVLKLPLEDGTPVSNIKIFLKIMQGWRWNLIPLFIIELVVCVLAFLDAREGQRQYSVRRDKEAGHI